MNKPFFLIVMIIISVLSSSEMAFAQTGVSLEIEIQNIESTIARQGVSAAEKHEALVRLARLRQLSGDIEGAARNWLEAAAVIPGWVDDDALLACAFCLAAMGEWDRAAAALEPLLSKNVYARFLDLSIKAIKNNNTSILSAIVDNPEYIEMKSQIIFILWKISQGTAAESWRQRLITEFPQSLEGRLAVGGSSSIIIRPTAFWLFAGGLDSLALVESPATQTAQTTSASTSQTSSTSTTQTTSAVTPGPRLQTGVFSRQANAQAQAASLNQAGFTASIENRIVNNTEMWAVTVPVGSDQAHTVNALRAAGFESFLVR